LANPWGDHQSNRWWSPFSKGENSLGSEEIALRFAEITRVLVRFNHVANIIVNADQGIVVRRFFYKTRPSSKRSESGRGLFPR
jgi:hypothetical protein